MNVNDRNHLLECLHESLDEFKAEHAPKYDMVRVEKAGANGVSFQVDQPENESSGHGTGTKGD